MASGQVMYDGRWISTASDLGKEVMKFENRVLSEHEKQWPRMMYKAERTPNGKVKCMEDAMVPSSIPDAQISKEETRIENFNRGNQFTVKDYNEYMTAKDRGWSDSPGEAVAAFERNQIAIGNAAAERAYTDSKMSEKAQEEVAAVEAATEFHVPVIPEKKIDKRTKAYKEAHKVGA